jgi:hypothetical protein
MPDELWHQRARALPIAVRPVPGELIISHVRRLAAENHSTVHLLIRCFGRHRSHPAAGACGAHSHDLALNRPALERLAIYSGTPPTTLLAATTTKILSTDNHEPQTEWITLHGRRLAHPCRQCVAGRCSELNATIALTEDQPSFCLRHQRILPRLDLAAVPLTLHTFAEIAAAGRRHQALRRKRRTAFPLALRAAAKIVRDWRPYAERRRHAPEAINVRWHARAERLHLPHTDELVRYPETIALADLLSTLSWPDQDADILTKPAITAPVLFLAHAARYLNHPEPRELLKCGHPLHRWAKVPLRPGYWWREYGTDPDKTAYFTLHAAKRPDDI